MPRSVDGVGQLVRFRSPAWQTASLREDTRIVATTLSCAASETLRRHFQPDILVCDESEQCLEGDHMIGMSLESLKAVILIGDSNEPPLKAISKDSEYVQYLVRPLLRRLRDAGYPVTQLRTNH